MKLKDGRGTAMLAFSAYEQCAIRRETHAFWLNHFGFIYQLNIFQNPVVNVLRKTLGAAGREDINIVSERVDGDGGRIEFDFIAKLFKIFFMY